MLHLGLLGLHRWPHRGQESTHAVLLARSRSGPYTQVCLASHLLSYRSSLVLTKHRALCWALET